MSPFRYTRLALCFFFFLNGFSTFCQLGIHFQIKKPKEYDEQELGSEKTEEKKFTLPRHIIQNAVTHYNFFFNANNKLNSVLERAKAAHKDDYSELLSFYNYTLDATQQDSVQLDSVSYKSSTDIALHDLRNDWIDNMYLLWGISYYLQQKFDSAYLMLQFINYAFAPRYKDGSFKTIGSNRDGNSVFSISTKEDNSLIKKIFTVPPSRNDAFIWQIRNYLAQDSYAEAASLIVSLKKDPNFPSRLKNDLEEVQSFWFYKQNMYDSAAIHLVKALSNATNLQEKARWEFLAAQLFALAKHHQEASRYFEKASLHTNDPVMEVYAKLYAVRNDNAGEKDIQKNADALLRMAKHDRYQDYKDIIYYMAAEMLIEAGKLDEAIALLEKSTKEGANNLSQRNKAFLQLGEIYYDRKQYRKAASFYDSINLGDPALKNKLMVESRKKSLDELARNIDIIYRQDSLQRIAALPEDQRKEFVKKLVKELRKEQGLKDETVNNGTTLPANNTVSNTLFPVSSKGEWYFYNTDYRTQGLADFKNKWGNRPNADNWRRSAAVTGFMNNNPNNQVQQGNNFAPVSGKGVQGTASAISFERLYANLPIEENHLKQSNDSLKTALFSLGKIYVMDIEDCNEGTRTLEELRKRFPDFIPMDQLLFNLYYCYNKNGDNAKASAIKNLMSEKFDTSKLTKIVITGKDPKRTATEEATKTYEDIYDLFIEGKFDEAVSRKRSADSMYGNNYWTPQLLYIEAVYYIKQRNDSTAINVLNALLSKYQSSPMAAKASRLINVLKRRKEIEEELTRLNIKRYPEDTVLVFSTQVPVYTNPKDSTKKPVQPVINQPKDTTHAKPPPNSYWFGAGETQYVAVVLNKVDPVFVNETRNAIDLYDRDNYPSKNLSTYIFDLDADNRLVLVSTFKDTAEAISYIDKTKPRMASEIVPWLKGGKFSFIMLSDNNFDLLKVRKNIEEYRTWLNRFFPGKF